MEVVKINGNLVKGNEDLKEGIIHFLESCTLKKFSGD